MEKLKKLFTDHPNEMGESYIDHLFCASIYGVRMVLAGFAAIIHSIFPFLFQTTASDLAKEITGDVRTRKSELQAPEKVELQTPEQAEIFD
jgi:hypothetical protein